MQDILVHNPWWHNPADIEKDEDYRRWLESGVRWTPPLLHQIPLEKPSLNFLFGPRQVGKTTLLKLLVNRLLKQGVNPESIFYYRCDQLADYKELDSIIAQYLKYREARGIHSSYIILDEITSPSQWYRTIKYNIDVGKLSKDWLMLSGSLSMYVKREVETFPGRRGKGRDYIMHPLSFREFVNIAEPGLRLGNPLSLDDENLFEKASELLKLSGRLQELFEAYLQSGGFPLPVRSLIERGHVTHDIIDVYLSWIKGDLARVGANEAIAKRVLKGVLEKAPTRLSLLSIAREFEIGSHRTVFKYLDLFEKLFLIKILYHMDPFKATENLYKNRKVHLTDPFLYTALSHWCLTERPGVPAVVEGIVASHLARKYNVAYWSNRTELDIVAFTHKHRLTGIEVKYSRKAEPTKLRAGGIRNVITLSIDQFEKEPTMLPVAVFLAALDV
jgi:predicted AAA+ superfamily ATPase